MFFGLRSIFFDTVNHRQVSHRNKVIIGVCQHQVLFDQRDTNYKHNNPKNDGKVMVKYRRSFLDERQHS